MSRFRKIRRGSWIPGERIQKVLAAAMLVIVTAGFTPKTGELIELQAAFNGRSSADFRRVARNIEITLPARTVAKIEEVKRFHSGNYGLKVTVQGGAHDSKVVWVHYNPNKALIELCSNESGAQCVKTAQVSEARRARTQQSVTALRDPAAVETSDSRDARPQASANGAASSGDSRARAADGQSAATRAASTQPGISRAADIQRVSSSPLQASEEATEAAVDRVVERLLSLKKASADDVGCGEPSVSFLRRRSYDPVTGAHLVLASMYQSCSATRKELTLGSKVPHVPSYQLKGWNAKRGGRVRKLGSSETARAEFLMDHYLLGDLSDPMYSLTGARRGLSSDSCVDVTRKPPIYAFGSRPRYQGDRLLTHSTDLSEKRWGCGRNGVSCDSAPVIALDCSAFISAAFAASGLKLYPKGSTQIDVNTNGLDAASKRNDSCLERPYIGASGLLPGDILNLSGNHVVLIDRVGEDPLGVQRFVRTGKDCNDLEVKDFDFTYVHSGVETNGPARVNIQYYARHKKGRLPTWLRKLSALAERLCKYEKRNPGTQVRFEEGDKMSLIRHKGPEKAGCTFTPMKVEGQECVNGCA